MNRHKEIEGSKPHFSGSQIDMVCRCGEAWRRRYAEGDKTPPPIVMLKGKGVHKGIETNMSQKIETHVDLAAADVVEAAVTSFETEVEGGYELSEPELARGNRAVIIGEAKDEVARVARAHVDEQAREYQPTEVEASFRLTLDDCTHDYVGFVDFVGTAVTSLSSEVVTDWKTSKRKPNDGIEHDSTQLTGYAAWRMSEGVELPVTVRLDVLVDKPVNKRRKVAAVERYVMESQRDVDDIAALAARINVASKLVEAGLFAPAMPGSWWCSPSWCGYWKTCPYVNSERRAKAELSAKTDAAIMALI